MAPHIIKTLSIVSIIIMMGVLLGCAHGQPHRPDNLDVFLNADTTNGPHKYVLGVHDCMDFSICMAEKMTTAGYDTGVVFVLAKDPYTNYSHMLVCVNISNVIYYVEPMHDYVYAPNEYAHKFDSKNYDIHEISIDDAKNTRDEMRGGIWNGSLI